MVILLKANGEREQFLEQKLRSSIRRAGIPQDIEQQVVDHIKSKLYENMPTSEVYQHLSEFLDKSLQPYHKARYSLKQSIMELGPTGYPFEDYVARLLNAQGYTTIVRSIVAGKCIGHEVDVIAQQGPEKIMVEAKFHNGVGIKTDVQVSLYVQARFEDVATAHGFTKPMLITNTKATIDAITYAHCVRMDIVTWSYPEGDSLRDWVERSALYPITALSTLPHTLKEQLLNQGIVLCKDLLETPSLLDNTQLPHKRKKEVLKEVEFLCE